MMFTDYEVPQEPDVIVDGVSIPFEEALDLLAQQAMDLAAFDPRKHSMGISPVITWEQSVRDRERMRRAGIVASSKRTRVRDSAKAERLRRIGLPEGLVGPSGIRQDLNEHEGR